MRRLFSLLTAVTLVMMPTANAAIFATLDQTTDGLRYSFSGTLDTDGLTPFEMVGGPVTAFLVPDSSTIGVQGEACETCIDLFFADAPVGFSIADGFLLTDVFSIEGAQGFGFDIVDGLGSVAIGDAYVSGSVLSGDAFFAGATLAALGIIPGTFTWTLPKDDFVSLTVTEVPLPPAAFLFAPVIAGFAWRRRRKAIV